MQQAMKYNRALLVFFLILSAIGVGLMLCNVLSILYCRQFIQTMPSVPAIVTKITTRQREGEKITKAFVSYTVNAEQFTDIYVRNQRYVVALDDTIPIHYDPDEPRRIVAANQSYTGRFVNIAFGLLLACFPIRSIRALQKQDKMYQNLMGAGIRVEATVTDVIINASKGSVTIKCAYRDSHDLQTYEFTGRQFRCDAPESLLGATVPVIVDMNDMETYYVETDKVETAHAQ